MPATGTGVIDHVGFRTTGLLEMIEHLTKNKISFTERQVNDQGLYQLFLFDPNGLKIELNFANAEAKGRTPQLKASELSPATKLNDQHHIYQRQDVDARHEAGHDAAKSE